MSNSVEVPTVDVDVTTHGEFPGIAGYVQDKIGGLARLAPRPVAYARVRLTRAHDPAAERPVVGQANLEVGGRLLRAQVEAATAREAVDALEARLRGRLEHLAQRWDTAKGPGAAPPWRQARLLLTRSREPAIVRRKSYAMAPCSVDEAIAEMELLDYDFHLFTEIGSGTAAVVYRSGSTGYRLALVAPDVAGAVAPYRRPVTVSAQPLPCLREHDAVERLELLGHPFLFFIEAAQGRVGVLYRRFDGDYGLIAPAGET
ncbi:ribosome hibernation promotion factor [Mycolicibacterium vaccae]|uniref:ribosome hibernation promotion factor n=1 Tax=Mycolicibacterium vaccae TaxID=1810 RepID=UPI003D05232B